MDKGIRGDVWKMRERVARLGEDGVCRCCYDGSAGRRFLIAGATGPKPVHPGGKEQVD